MSRGVVATFLRQLGYQTRGLTRGFASPSRDGFALIEKGSSLCAKFFCTGGAKRPDSTQSDANDCQSCGVEPRRLPRRADARAPQRQQLVASSTCVAILTISNLRNVTLSSLYAFPTILRCDSRLLLRSSSEFWFALEERRRDRSSAALAIRVEPARAVASDSRVLARLGAPPPRSGRAGDAPRGTGAAAHPGDEAGPGAHEEPSAPPVATRRPRSRGSSRRSSGSRMRSPLIAPTCRSRTGAASRNIVTRPTTIWSAWSRRARRSRLTSCWRGSEKSWEIKGFGFPSARRACRRGSGRCSRPPRARRDPRHRPPDS